MLVFEPMTTIRLWGELGDKFVPEVSANISNCRDAINFLCSQFPEFKSYILESNCNYSLTCVGDGWQHQISSRNTDFPIAGKTLVIAPVIDGGGGVLNVFKPIALIGVGLLTGNPALIIGGVVSGLQSIFFGYPDKPKDDERSVNFQGNSPQTREGTPIPIAIGSRIKITEPMILSYSVVSEYTDL